MMVCIYMCVCSVIYLFARYKLHTKYSKQRHELDENIHTNMSTDGQKINYNYVL